VADEGWNGANDDMAGTGTSADNGHTAGRAVVLGGTGFVGRPVCRALAQRGFEVVAVARHNRSVPHATSIVPMDLATADQAEIAAMLRERNAAVVVNAAGGMWGLSDDEMVFANTTLTEHVIGAVAALPHRPRTGSRSRNWRRWAACKGSPGQGDERAVPDVDLGRPYGSAGGANSGSRIDRAASPMTAGMATKTQAAAP
jgi:NAD(P)-dependent dehydrogenase (short-subunit alcohol dehydrogenase family)